MKKNKLLNDNRFLINASICTVVLLLMFYFGINGSTKKTYSAAVDGQCAVGYSLGEINAGNGVIQFCCPSGYTAIVDYSEPYCVANDLSLDYTDSGLSCIKKHSFSSVTADQVSSSCSSLGTGWSYQSGTIDSCGGRGCTYSGATCSNTDLSNCTVTPEKPTYSGSCFIKEDGSNFSNGNKYLWTSLYEDGMVLVKSYSTETACTAANQETKKCFVNSSMTTGPKYRWLTSSANSNWVEDSSYTTEKSCLSNNRYVIEYKADSHDTGVTNLPGIQYKYHYDTVELSSRVPVRDGYKFLYWRGTSSKQIYYPGDYYSLESNVSFTAIWEEIVIKDINLYELDGKMFKKIPINTTDVDFKSNITLGSSYSMNVAVKTVNNKDVLYTGSKATILKGTSTKEIYDIVVNGDVNGDGELHPTDFVYIHNHLNAIHTGSTSGLLSDLYLVAADFDNDGSVHPKDNVELHNYLTSH